MSALPILIALLVGIAIGFALSEYVRRAEQRAYAQGSLQTKMDIARRPR